MDDMLNTFETCAVCGDERLKGNAKCPSCAVPRIDAVALSESQGGE